ncbi:MAG: branched-chain amino acid ABC transporter permease [Spirochaetales bacterium]|uniref:Branched-chain amino acid ABC transporter permease n=1 Tax=Candidatus Thalassospirochaeta sargassi TaxID=3119039 RepID=A0AAJ1IFK2_9SPIO|nr:branched-chain amino acid ABC transporter permease [Spirochaetales bacterium]
MEILIAQIFNGLSIGSIYVLLVTGFNLLLLVAMIIHFSFPVVVVFSMYISWFVMTLTGSVALGVAGGIASAVVVNVITAPMFQHIMRERGSVDINATMVISMGMGMIITDILSHTFNQGFPIAFPDALTGNDQGALISVGLVSISRGQVLTLIVGIIFVAFLFWLLYKTRAGRAFRAIAEDPNGAKLVGIPLLKTGFQSYALTGILGGVTAVLMAVLLGSASAGLGDQLGHKVLAVSIIAGLGNLTGGLIIGLLLGILEAIIQGYLAGSWSNAIAFIVMLVVILAKPKGVFGSKL